MTAGETPRRKQHGVKREQGGITEGAFVLPDLAPRIGVGAGAGGRGHHQHTGGQLSQELRREPRPHAALNLGRKGVHLRTFLRCPVRERAWEESDASRLPARMSGWVTRLTGEIKHREKAAHLRGGRHGRHLPLPSHQIPRNAL